MNMLLLLESDLIAPDTAVVSGRRHEHIRDVLGRLPGQNIRIGMLNGPRGTGEIIMVSESETRLAIQFDQARQPPPGVSVILAMVRPRIARQALITLASLGVRRIMFINARRVAKPYFSQRLFDADQYKEFLHLGLEQGGEVWMPEVSIHRRFNIFIEDEMARLIDAESRRYIAHPVSCEDDAPPVTPVSNDEVALAIGPEGGWVDYEVDKFIEHGFHPLRLGNHILRVETAIPYAFGKLRLG